MSYNTLLHGLGFERDPFAKTNADEEDLLEDYFIEPPFFKAVYGSIHEPKSAVVYAPRGGGKTALKRRIELSARTDAFLSITYNYFPAAGLKLKDITLDYHLKNISRILLVGILSAATRTGLEELTSDERHLLYVLCKEHLSSITRADLNEAIAGVTNLTDKAKEVWNMLTGPISAGVAVAAAHWGFKGPEVNKFEEDKSKVGNFHEQIRFMSGLAPKFGFFQLIFWSTKLMRTFLRVGLRPPQPS